MKEVFRKTGYDYILQYWSELLEFFSDEENVFDDVPDFLIDEYSVGEDDAIEIYESLYEVLYAHRSQLEGFFEEGGSGKSVKSVKPENEYTGAKGLKMLDESPHGRLHPPLPRNDVVRQAHHDNTAQFYFSPEDEEEIKNIQRLASSGQGLGKDAMDKIYDRVAEEVVRKVGMYQ